MSSPNRKTRKYLVAAIVTILIVILILSYFIPYFLFTQTTSSAPETVYQAHPQVSQYTIEYPTLSNGSSPNAIAVDSHGNIWFDLGNEDALAELNPANGTVHQYRMPPLPKKDTSTLSWGLAIDNSRGLVWFTEVLTNSVWSFNLTSHKFKQFPIGTPNALPFGLTVDSSHNVWFAELSGGKIGEISSNGSLYEFQIPTSGDSEPSGITTDSTGRVWFTLAGIQSVGSYFQGTFKIYNLTGLLNTPVGISLDPQGDIWLTNHASSFISEFDPSTGYFRTFSTSNNSLIVSLPYFSWVDGRGTVWFDEHQGNAMGEFFPSNNTLIEYFIPTRVVIDGNISGMLTSALSPSGEPWYTEFFTGKVGTINTAAPLDVSLRLTNYTSSVGIPSVSNGSEISFGLNVTSLPSAGTISMHGYIGNYSDEGSFTFSFSPSAVSIRNDGSLPGVYFLTVSALSNSLGVSQIIEVRVP
jgi:virginiamycin B lyase